MNHRKTILMGMVIFAILTLMGCDTTKYTVIRWSYCNNGLSDQYSGSLNLETGYHVKGCNADYANKQIIIQIEKE